MANTQRQRTRSSFRENLRKGQQRITLNALQFRRGRDKQWHFSGQQPDEVVRLIVRKHWWFLVLPGLPFLGAIIVLFVILWVSTSIPGPAALWNILYVIVSLAILVTGILFIFKALIKWWFLTYIITSKRIINSEGWLEPQRQQTPIEKVQQVKVDVNTLLGFLLGFGNVSVYLTGGIVNLRDVPHPTRVRDAIQGLTEEVKAKKPKEEKPPTPQSPALAEVIDKLATHASLAPLPNADENLPPPRTEGRYLGPRRTFGGFLRISANVRYTAGEYSVKYVQRSRFVLLRNLSPFVLLLLIVLPIAIIAPSSGSIPLGAQQVWWLVAGVIILVLLGIIAGIYLNYVDDVYILTNRRIIDINRKFVLFFETRIETEYRNIRDTKVKVPNVIESFLDIGHVYVETPGSSPDIILYDVDHPFFLQDEIQGIKSHKEKEDNTKKANTEKDNMKKWFSNVIVQLEETTKTIGAPDLRKKDWLSAMMLAQDYGLKVAVQGEAEATENLPPGFVVRQSPPAGTLMQRDAEIEIVLSKKQSSVNH